MLNQRKIGARLGIGFGVVLALLAVITAFSWWRLERDADAIHRMMGEPLAKERLMSDWYQGIHTSVRRTTAVVRSADPSLAAFFAKENVEASKLSNEYQKSFEALLRDPEEQRRFAEIATVRKAYIAARDDITAIKAKDPQEATRLFDEKFGAAAKGYLGALQSMLDYQRAQLNRLAQQVEDASMRARQLMLALGCASAALGAFFAWSITRSVTRPLRHAVAEARRIASGDLSKTVEAGSAKDEAGQLLAALGAMQESLAQMIDQIRVSTESIGHASSEIATGNLDLSARTEETASNLQHAASSIEQLTGTVRQTADSAVTANRLATQAEATAAAGGAVVVRVVDTMAGINASSKKIGDITGVIDAIAFQTNILALNAAVEAARAGEQGRGFSVVAAEVRNLAQRSAEAAKQIKSLIVASVAEVDSGTRLVGDAGQAMKDIVGAVQRVSAIIGEITVAAAEQSSGIEQVNSAVAQLDQMTQQNAALVEESAAAAESLRDQAGRLGKSVDAFRLQ